MRRLSAWRLGAAKPVFPLGLLFLLGLTLLGMDMRPQPPAPSTWSIVAWDSESDSFGVAAASCWPDSIVTIAAIVPGRGAGVAQGLHHPSNRLRLFQLIADENPADGIVAVLRDGAVDPLVEARQYAAVTLDDGTISASAFTGDANPAWAGHQLAPDGSYSVQGNILTGAAVVQAAFDAYAAGVRQRLTFPERLLTALEAGSEAGGDRRCNSVDHRQTAASAFVAVARSSDPPLGGGAATDGPPWLLFSASEPIGGPNPLPALRRQYDSWRDQHATMVNPELPTQPVTADPGSSEATNGAKRLSDQAWRLLAVVAGIAAVAMLIFAARKSAME